MKQKPPSQKSDGEKPGVGVFRPHIMPTKSKASIGNRDRNRPEREKN